MHVCSMHIYLVGENIYVCLMFICEMTSIHKMSMNFLWIYNTHQMYCIVLYCIVLYWLVLIFYFVVVVKMYSTSKTLRTWRAHKYIE